MTVVRTDKARQGGRGRRVLVILVAALILAGIAAIFLDLFDRDAVDADIGEPGVELQDDE